RHEVREGRSVIADPFLRRLVVIAEQLLVEMYAAGDASPFSGLLRIDQERVVYLGAAEVRGVLVQTGPALVEEVVQIAVRWLLVEVAADDDVLFTADVFEMFG